LVGSGTSAGPRLCGSGWAPDPGCLGINNNNNNNNNIIIIIIIIIDITNIIICIIINIINIIINKFLKNIINIEKQP
jgi:hypothetical protein